MSGPQDSAEEFERALSESQRQERAELATELERQRQADERVVSALAGEGDANDGNDRPD